MSPGLSMSAASEEGIFHAWEPPDTIVARYVGDLHVGHVRTAQLHVKALQQGLPHFLMLLEVSQLKSVSSDARRAMSENGETAKSLRGTAIVGASFRFRALGSLIARAVALLNRDIDNPLRFFATTDEAHAWLAERRLELAAPR